MGITAQLSAVVSYIENNLDGEIDYYEIGRMSNCSAGNFQRLFSYLTPYTLSDYIRARRLTQAGLELSRGQLKVIDVAAKYGYVSPDSFTRAFREFHGVTPGKVRLGQGKLNSCQPLQIEVIVSGGMEMEYEIRVEAEFTVCGVTEVISVADAFETVPKLWAKAQKSGLINRLLEHVGDGPPPGLLGVAAGGDWGAAEELHYTIGFAISSAQSVDHETRFHSQSYPAAQWVVITANGTLPEAVQNVYEDFYQRWLPTSGYTLADLPVIECYLPAGRQQVWIAVVPD